MYAYKITNLYMKQFLQLEKEKKNSIDNNFSER